VDFSLGIDLAEPDRLAQRLEARPELANELFTPREQAYCRAQYHWEQSFAGRFAAKEAVVKALELDGWDPLEIEILEGDPAPRIQLHGSAADAARARGVEVRISVTHLSTVAAAVALALPRASPER
jgi:holo-[acyl-carrier protein] synthase